MLLARDLALDIQSGRLSPGDLMARCADAIAEREPEIGAFVALDLAAARQQAAAEGVAARPLAGLPFGIKDII
ncbi:MAG: hypothetical protein B7X76_03605, partial [Azorhizobium sp. 39-67-5]